MKILYSPSWSAFNIGETQEDTIRAFHHLRKQGYTETQAKRIINGGCPRDLPALHEVFDKFGGRGLEYIEVEDQPYYIDCDYESSESVITKDMLTPSGVEMKPDGKPGDWEVVDVSTDSGAIRVANALNAFIDDKDKGSPFVVEYQRWHMDIQGGMERKALCVKRFFFERVEVLDGENTTDGDIVMGCVTDTDERLILLKNHEIKSKHFEVDHAQRILTVKGLEGNNEFSTTFFRGTEADFHKTSMAWSLDLFDEEELD